MKLLAVALVSIACCAIIAGICVELLIGGEAGYIIISVGCLGVMVGSLIYGKIFKKSHV